MENKGYATLGYHHHRRRHWLAHWLDCRTDVDRWFALRKVAEHEASISEKIRVGPPKPVRRKGRNNLPMQAQMALANGELARMLRHAARCNCGQGKAHKGCTTRRAVLYGSTPERRDREYSTILVLERNAATARQRMNGFRLSRVVEPSRHGPMRDWKKAREG